MTAVTFPLRPPRLAFAIYGRRWQNDIYEIKYSVCVEFRMDYFVPAVTSFMFFQLLELGVSLEVLSVTSSNAGSFRFMGGKYLSEAVLTGEEGARTEDGGVLYAGDDGMLGLEEIKR